jgi:hypothetical protein
MKIEGIIKQREKRKHLVSKVKRKKERKDKMREKI